jgi:hypothetical protein
MRRSSRLFREAFPRTLLGVRLPSENLAKASYTCIQLELVGVFSWIILKGELWTDSKVIAAKAARLP